MSDCLYSSNILHTSVKVVDPRLTYERWSKYGQIKISETCVMSGPIPSTTESGFDVRDHTNMTSQQVSDFLTLLSYGQA